MTLMPQQVFEQLELARREIHEALSANHATGDEVQLQVSRVQTKDVRWPATTQQGTDARHQLGQREWLDEVVVRAEVESQHSIVHAVPCRQDQDRCFNVALSQGLQDLQSAAA